MAIKTPRRFLVQFAGDGTIAGNLMRKMRVRVVADRVNLAERAGVGSVPGMRDRVT